MLLRSLLIRRQVTILSRVAIHTRDRTAHQAPVFQHLPCHRLGQGDRRCLHARSIARRRRFRPVSRIRLLFVSDRTNREWFCRGHRGERTALGEFLLDALRHFAGQHIDRLLADQECPVGGIKFRYQGDRLLVSADSVPRNPHAVGSAKLGWRIVSRQLVGREHEFLVWYAIGTVGIRIVITIDDQLAFDGYRLTAGIVEVYPATKSASCRRTRLVVDSFGPNRDDSRRLLIGAFNDLGFVVEPWQVVGNAIGHLHRGRLAANEKDRDQTHL